VRSTAHSSAVRTVAVSDAAWRRLRRLNLGAAALHAVQAAAMLALSTAVSLPVTALFASGPPGTKPDGAALETLFQLRLGPAVAAFLLLTAVFHLLLALGPGQARYRAELSGHRNRFRWVEYSLSASVMIVLIAMITGITDVAALIALFGVNASMILFGWLMETTNEDPSRVRWSPFVMGCLAGVVPWLAIAIYLIGAGADVPGFVYGIFVSLFVLFNVFALVQYLQYRAHGRWSDYLRGERAYIVLSLVAKSLLAWQVFANVLV
jgi:hypothetical protein